MSVEIGDRAKDRISGFTGIVVTRSDWMNNCLRFGLQAERLDEKGHKPDVVYFDEPDLVVTKKAVYASVRPARTPAAATGGPDRQEDRRH